MKAGLWVRDGKLVMSSSGNLLACGCCKVVPCEQLDPVPSGIQPNAFLSSPCDQSHFPMPGTQPDWPTSELFIESSPVSLPHYTEWQNNDMPSVALKADFQCVSGENSIELYGYYLATLEIRREPGGTLYYESNRNYEFPPRIVYADTDENGKWEIEVVFPIHDANSSGAGDYTGCDITMKVNRP